MVVLLLALAAALLQTAPVPVAAPSGSIDNGKRLYTSYYCYACHGTQGQGGKDGARIAPNPTPWTSFRNYIRKPAANMPAYSSAVATDQELADIYAFLKSIPPSRAAKSIPLLAR